MKSERCGGKVKTSAPRGELGRFVDQPEALLPARNVKGSRSHFSMTQSLVCVAALREARIIHYEWNRQNFEAKNHVCRQEASHGSEILRTGMGVARISAKASSLPSSPFPVLAAYNPDRSEVKPNVGE